MRGRRSALGFGIFAGRVLVCEDLRVPAFSPEDEGPLSGAFDMYLSRVLRYVPRGVASHVNSGDGILSPVSGLVFRWGIGRGAGAAT